jgi:hypothetical protein
MRRSKTFMLPLLLLVPAVAGAQVVPSVEIRDAELHALQQGSMNQLKVVATNLTSHHFDFPFYFSRKLDIDQKQQQRIDQHSIRFERFDGAIVLAISGNYYGAYSSEKFSEELRARQTFLTVVLPIVKAAVPVFQGDPKIQGYAIEVSHHVFSKTMGMPIERAENLMVYLPQTAAVKLVAAQGKLGQQAALLEAEVFLNANPLNLWLTDDEQPPNEVPRTQLVDSSAPPVSTRTIKADANEVKAELSADPTAPDPRLPAAASLSALAPVTVRDTSPQALAMLQSSIEGTSNHMLKELEPQAHFVAYAPPAFIAFRHQTYLEFSVDTVVSEAVSNTSRYKLAALAFDEHISPLIRRVIGYFPDEQHFDGISFSSTVHGLPRPGGAATKPLSVEFFFPLRTLRCYESYDCTGQQLLDAGTILLNGERVGLDLQIAEGGRP